MSDFMKEIVGQILNSNQAESSDDENKTTALQQKHQDGSSFGSIKRPNYQSENKNKRLSTTSNENLSANSMEVSLGKERRRQQPNVTVIPNHYTSDALSQLQVMSLSKGQTHNGHRKNRELAEMIGKSNAGGSAWFFPNLSEGVEKFFSRNPQGTSAGCVNLHKCYPSQLLYVNNIIRENQEAKFYMEWNKENNSEFLLEVFHEDGEWIKTTLHQLFQKLKRNTMKPFEVFKVDYPSTWLSNHLDVNVTVEGLCIIEGLPYYSNISLLDHVLKLIPEGVIDYNVEKEYLLIAGNQAAVGEAEAVLKRNGGQFIG